MEKFLCARFAAGVMAVLMAVALAGCTPQEAGSVSEMTFSDDDGPLTPYAETLTVTQVKAHDPNISYIDGESKDDNFITRFYKEKLNVVWESKWETDPSSYYTKLSLDIASDDLPDVFMVNASQLKTLVQNGQIQPLTNMYEHFASDNMRKNIEYDDKLALKLPTVGGQLYGIPLTTAYEGNIGFMWLRTDWMESLGLQAPTTYEEFVAFLTRINESGINGGETSAFSFIGPGSVAFDCIAHTEGAYYDYWVKDPETGKLVYSSIQPQMRAALLKMQDMFSRGLIDRDFAIKGATEQELIAKGQYGVVFGQYFYPELLKGSVLNNPDATWNAYPIPVNGEGKLRPKGNTFVKAYAVVRKGYEHPEALMKSLNLWGEVWMENGQYREWYTDQMTTTYQNVVLCGEYALPFSFDGVETQMSIGRYIRAAYASDNPAEEIEKYPYARMTWGYMADENAPNFVSGEGWKLKTIYTTSEKVMEEQYKDIQFDEFQSSYSDDAAFYKTTLDKRMLETFINIIMGEPIETFDSFVEEWKSLGGDEITEEVNEWYSAQSN